MNRRDFFKGAGATAALVLVGGCAGGFPVIPARPDAGLEDASSWIAWDGQRYSLSIPRAELGQNISTAMKQVACTELGADWDKVDVILPDTSAIPPYRATVGSESIQDYAIPLAQACATLREAIRDGKTGVIEAEDRPLANLRAFTTTMPAKTPIVGMEAIVFGAPLYVGDLRLPDMVYGRVLRADWSPELPSHPRVIDDSAAKKVPGFVGMISDERLNLNNSQGIGILATTPGALDRIEAAMTIKWDLGKAGPGFDKQLKLDGRTPEYFLESGSAEDVQSWDIDISVTTPLAAHSPIETHSCVADYKDGVCRLYASSQDPFYVRDLLADRFDMQTENIIVQPMRVGGGFGGKVVPLAEFDAMGLSMAIGRPVKVQWTRRQEFTQAYYRPPTRHRVRAKLDKGKITHWDHQMASGHVIFTNAVLPEWIQFLTDFMGDDGAARNLLPPYEFADTNIGYRLERLDVRTAAWRGLGAGPNSLAIEMAMEATAKAAGTGPIAFRLQHMPDPRLQAALLRVAEMAGPPPAKGRGVGCGIYKGVSYGAVIVDAAYDNDGLPSLSKIHVVHDCGKIISPDQIRAQCEGNIAWSIGMILMDKLSLEGARIEQQDLVDSPLPTMADLPPIQIDLIDSGETPTGAGETLMAAAPAAIANALIDLTGHRPDRFPVDLAGWGKG